MASYVLEEGEVIVLRDDNVLDSAGKDTTLILTNRHIIKIVYDIWGNGKDHYFALSRLRENNGNPNVRIGKDPRGKNRLELYFEKSQQFFTFKSLFAGKKWFSAIVKAYKSRMKEIAKIEREPMNIGKVFAPVLGKIDAAKDALTSREQRVQAKKCPFCGAIIDAEKGTEVTCKYCDSTFTL